MTEPLVVADGIDDQEFKNLKIVYDGLKNPPTTSSGLYKWLTALSGEFIPFKPCCPNHQTPWDYIWRSYRIDLDKWKDKTKRNMVFLGTRRGYKTLSTAKLIVAELLLKKNCQIVGIAAIENQSDLCYRYVQRYLLHPVIVKSGMVKKLLMKETAISNGSIYQQAVASLAGVNSKHPAKLRCEELDAGMKPEIIADMMMMPSSSKGLTAHSTYASTRKFDDGNMQDLIDKGTGGDFDLVTVCYKDVSEPCLESRRGKEKKTYEVEDIYNPGQTLVVEAFENCGKCHLLPSCKGDLEHAHGGVPIDDVIEEFLKLDRETWIRQKECATPRTSNTFFGDYWREDIQSGYHPYRSSLGWVDMVIDFTGGGDEPTCVQFWQTDENDNDFCVGELVYSRKLLGQVASEIMEYVASNNMQIRYQFGDSAAMQWISELNSFDPKFFKIRPVRKIARRDGWMLLRNRIRDNNGNRRVFIDKRCKLILSELKAVKTAYSDPGDIKNGQSDHGLDCARYRMVELRYHGHHEPNIRLITGYGDDLAVIDGSKLSKKEDEKKSLWDRFITED